MTYKPSRTNSARWRKIREQRLTQDFEDGITRCPQCGIWLDYEYTRRPNSAEPDHIIPHSKGGKDSMDNTRTICRQCNQRLGAKTGNTRKYQAANRIIPETKIQW